MTGPLKRTKTAVAFTTRAQTDVQRRMRSGCAAACWAMLPLPSLSGDLAPAPSPALRACSSLPSPPFQASKRTARHDCGHSFGHGRLGLRRSVCGAGLRTARLAGAIWRVIGTRCIASPTSAAATAAGRRRCRNSPPSLALPPSVQVGATYWSGQEPQFDGNVQVFKVRAAGQTFAVSRWWRQEAPSPWDWTCLQGGPARLRRMLYVACMGAHLARIQKGACMHQTGPACRWTWPAERACTPAWMLWGPSQREPRPICGAVLPIGRCTAHALLCCSNANAAKQHRCRPRQDARGGASSSAVHALPRLLQSHLPQRHQLCRPGGTSRLRRRWGGCSTGRQHPHAADGCAGEPRCAARQVGQRGTAEGAGMLWLCLLPPSLLLPTACMCSQALLHPTLPQPSSAGAPVHRPRV